MGNSLVFNAPGLEPFKLNDETARVYEKEAIYVGDFYDAEGVKHTIREADLDHWKKSVDEFIANKIPIPLPLEHTENPERNRGEVVGAVRKKNERGVDSLYLHTKFRDAEAEKLAASAHVSIFSPEQVSRNGKVYKSPLTHLALTDYPAVLGLERFKAIAASFVGISQMAVKFSLASLGESLQIPVAGKEDSDLEVAIREKITALLKELEDAKALIAELKGEGGDESETDEEEMPAPVAASILAMVKDNKEMKLNQLVQEGYLTPAARDAAAKEFCTDAAIKLSASGDDAEFQRFVKLARSNDKVLSFKEKTGGQGGGKVALSTTAKGKSVVADAAKKMADKAAKR